MWPHRKTPGYETGAAVSELDSSGTLPVAVLLVTDHFLPVVGGTEVTTLRDAKALRARGRHVYGAASASVGLLEDAFRVDYDIWGAGYSVSGSVWDEVHTCAALRAL